MKYSFDILSKNYHNLIFGLHEFGMNNSQIVRLAGISRERVRQILERKGARSNHSSAWKAHKSFQV